MNDNDIRALFPMDYLSAGRQKNSFLIGTPANIGSHTAELLGGAFLAIEDCNRSGGVGGRLVAQVWLNDRRESGAAAAVASEYMRMGIVHVVGHLSATAALAGSPVYERDGGVFLAPGTSHPLLTEGVKRRTFRVCGRDDRQAMLIAEAARQNPAWESAVLIQENTAYGRSLGTLIESVWPRGLVRLAHCGPPAQLRETAAWRPLLSSPPDLIIVAAIHELAAEIVAGLRDAGYRGDFIIGDDAYTPAFLQRGGKAVEGAWVVSLGYDEGSEETKTLHERYQSLTKQPAGAYMLTSYSATQILLDAIRETAAGEPDEVAECIRTRRWATPLGSIDFSNNGECQGVDWRWWQVAEGDFRQVNVQGERDWMLRSHSRKRVPA